MYLVSEAFRLAQKTELPAQDASALKPYRGAVEAATKFIPVWVKVAIAFGLGTMIGWKRIVVTVGEKIGKSHLTYGQGA
jgi:PiT family inorganic phosphate transporter